MVDVLTIGSVLQDVIFKTNQGLIIDTPEDQLSLKKLAFELGAKVSISDAIISVGGGAANAAATFALFGFQVAVSSRVGADASGTQVKDYLARKGIDTHLIQEDKRHKTGISLVLIKLPESEHVAFPYRGANESYVAPSSKELAALKPRCIYLSALQGSHWQKELEVIFYFAQDAHVPIVWNPGSAQIALPTEELHQFIRKTSVLLVNKDEATEIVAQQIPHERNMSIRVLLSRLISLGSKWVIITDGTQGAYATNGKETYQALALRVKAVDTTGAGDAFGSALVSGMMISDDQMETALKYAIVNSAAVVTEVGAQFGLLDREEAEKRLKRVIIKRI